MGHKVHPKDLQLRVPLDKEYTQMFRALKEHFGVQADTEAARAIINSVYKRTFPGAAAKEAPK
jgi:hypothetical protein